MTPLAEQREAALACEALYACKILEEAREEQKRTQEVSLVPPEAVAEVKKEHYLFHWNSNGVSVEDARAGRRASGRNPARRSVGIAAADARDAAQDAADEDSQQEGSKEGISGLGEGSALKHVGSESL